MVQKQYDLLPRLLTSFLVFFFDLLYHQMAWTYDLVAAIVSIGRWNDWVRSVLDDLPGPNVLELGHGPGHLQKAMGRSGLTAFGLDRSTQMGRIAYKQLRRARISARLTLGEAQHLPFPAQTFDQVVATFPTEYIADQRTLREVYRVLTPGGKLVVVPVAWILGKNLMDKLAAWLFRITGQAGEWNEAMLTPYSKTGFETRAEFRQIDHSSILVVLAHKPVD